jgi:DNA-binding NarL/FixJ family response regulator/GT2 family glycosyltransferase
MLDLVPRLSIVMPVYNEGENIRLVLEAVQREVKTRPIEVLVVYDFDEDNTVPVVVGMQALFPEVRLVRNDLGQGVLNALRKGFQVARASDVLVMMADGSDEPQVVDRMVALAAAGADVVAGSRYVRGGGQRGGPPLKRTLSHLAGVSLHWLAGLPVHDATSNFRLYSRRLLGAVTIESEAGFALAIELTVKAHRLGYRIDEVPTTWRDRTVGKSRFRLWAWMPQYLRWYWLALMPRVPVGQGRLGVLRLTPVGEPRIRVLIVDDHAVFCDGLATMLRIEADIEVVGKGGSVREAVQSARILEPDVVLLDVHMPDGSGVEAAAQIKKARPQTQVVILTSDEDESVLRAAVQAGVTGYLSKHEPAAQVVQAVRSAAHGEALIAPYMLARLLRGIGRPDQPSPTSPLTPRELVVLSELAQGQDNAAVARALRMSPNTVRTHVQNILAKLEVHSKLEAVSKAVREGWIEIAQKPAA